MNVETMKAELSKQPVVTGVQQHVAENWSSVRTLGRTIVLAYVGFWGVVYDNVADVYCSGAKLFDAAETRGIRMEQDFSQRFLRIEHQASDEIKRLQGQFGESIDQVKFNTYAPHGEAEDQLETRVELVLANLGVPSRQRLERLSQEIEELNHLLDRELATDHPSVV